MLLLCENKINIINVRLLRINCEIIQNTQTISLWISALCFNSCFVPSNWPTSHQNKPLCCSSVPFKTWALQYCLYWSQRLQVFQTIVPLIKLFYVCEVINRTNGFIKMDFSSSGTLVTAICVINFTVTSPCLSRYWFNFLKQQELITGQVQEVRGPLCQSLCLKWMSTFPQRTQKVLKTPQTAENDKEETQNYKYIKVNQ